MQCLAKTWQIPLNEKGVFLLVTKSCNLEKFFELGNSEQGAESKSAMRSCYFTGCINLLLRKTSMDKEILILFQNKYYCLIVLDILVSERNGNRETKKLLHSLFCTSKNPMKLKSAFVFCPISLLPWMLTERVLLKLAED